MAPVATVLVPTHDHSLTLGHAVASALGQTVSDLEVMIVGDGVPEATREVVGRLTAADERVRFLDNPKGAGNGELHRHAALADAKGRTVCYLADDDLWLPDHVETMASLLDEADFGAATTLRHRPGREPEVLVHDLKTELYRDLLLAGANKVPLSSGAHTMEMYRRLPHGWRPKPPGVPSDLHMWHQFLAEPSCHAASSARPTVLNFPAPDRRGWSPEERAAELEGFLRSFSDPDWHAGFAREMVEVAVRALAREWASGEGKRAKLEEARSVLARRKTQIEAREERIEQLKERIRTLEEARRR